VKEREFERETEVWNLFVMGLDTDDVPSQRNKSLEALEDFRSVDGFDGDRRVQRVRNIPLCNRSQQEGKMYGNRNSHARAMSGKGLSVCLPV